MAPKSRWTLPQVVHPTKYRKFVICVPDEQFYIAAFQGLLIELTYSKNWQRDSAHTAAVVSRVWQDTLRDVLCDDCGEIIRIEEMDDFMAICEQLRFQNGKLQGLCCGEWVDITGQTGNPTGGGTQPGEGSEQPPIGGCASYHAVMAGNNKWYLPTIVSTGDTIELTNVDGSGNDGALSPWQCPDGSIFFAGLCVGGTAAPAGGDPAAAANHMELVMNIDGAWYRPLAGVVTVPGGVSNAQVYIQVNDDPISDNAGGYSFDVEVCNNQPSSYAHTGNFTLSTEGFVNLISAGSTPDHAGQWLAGTGWSGTLRVNPSSANIHAVEIHLVLAAPVNIADFSMKYNLVKGTQAGGVDNEILLWLGGVTQASVLVPSISDPDGTGKVIAVPHGNYTVDEIVLIVEDQFSAGAGAAGTSVITGFTASGSGSDPF